MVGMTVLWCSISGRRKLLWRYVSGHCLDEEKRTNKFNGFFLHYRIRTTCTIHVCSHIKNCTSLLCNPGSLKHLYCEFKVILATPLSTYFGLRGVHQTAFMRSAVSLSAGAHLAFLQYCNTVALLQEDKCIFMGWIFTCPERMYNSASNCIFVHEWVDVKMDACLKIKFVALLEAADLLNKNGSIGFIHFTESVNEVNVPKIL